LQSEPKAIWLNQYANIANKNVHAEHTANEIAREFDKVDWFSLALAPLEPLRNLRATSSSIPGGQDYSRRAGRLSHFWRRTREAKHSWYWHQREAEAR
jgi:hypothetical protein